MARRSKTGLWAKELKLIVFNLWLRITALKVFRADMVWCCVMLWCDMVCVCVCVVWCDVVCVCGVMWCGVVCEWCGVMWWRGVCVWCGVVCLFICTICFTALSCGCMH
jgi:hypothetical protein